MNRTQEVTLLPFTKAMFSPLPTLFFTLLNNLWDTRTRGWSKELGERLFALSIYLHVYTDCIALKTRQQIQNNNRQIYRDEGHKIWNNTCIQLPRQAWRPGYHSTEGRKWTQCEKTKQKTKHTAGETKTHMNREELVNTESHILSSRQILGPMTLAAPETRRKATCFGGQGAESPHLYFRGRGSAKI